MSSETQTAKYFSPAGREAAKVEVGVMVIEYARAYVRSTLEAIEHGGPLGFLGDLDIHQAGRGQLLEQAHRLRRIVCPDNEWDGAAK